MFEALSGQYKHTRSTQSSRWLQLAGIQCVLLPLHTATSMEIEISSVKMLYKHVIFFPPKHSHHAFLIQFQLGITYNLFTSLSLFFYFCSSFSAPFNDAACPMNFVDYPWNWPRFLDLHSRSFEYQAISLSIRVCVSYLLSQRNAVLLYIYVYDGIRRCVMREWFSLEGAWTSFFWIYENHNCE